MRNRIRNEKGFTLIELVMVIVILGILAAVAVPRFVDLQGDARNSVASGITGALRGAITMAHARYLVNGGQYTGTLIATSVDVSGVTIAGAAAAITATLSGGQSYTWVYTDNLSAGNVSQIGDAVAQ